MRSNTIIITGVTQGDEKILKHFYKETMVYIRGYIIRNSGNTQDVEDVFQDAMIVLYLKLRSGLVELKSPIKTYFYGICKNIWRNRLRKQKKLLLTDSVHLFEKEVDTSFLIDIETNEREQLYRKHFQNLSLDNKKVLTLYFKGKSMKEISEITGYTEGYARKKKFEAKKSLLSMVEQDPLYEEIAVIPVLT